MRKAEGSPPAWPLVGRDDELDALRVALGAGGAYVTGEAGVGKSSLVTEALFRDARDDVAVTWVTATRSAASVPLSAFVDLLPAELPPTGDRLGVFRAVAAELAERAQGGRGVLVVDDAHLLAEPGAALLLHLARNGATLVATVETGASVPDAVAGLWKDDVLPRIDLSPLDAPEVGDVLTEVLGGPVERATVTRLHRATGGNPRYLRELVLAGQRSGGLALVDGLWRAADPLPVGRPLQELVRARVDALDPGVRTVLELVAVAEEWPLGALDDEHRAAVEVLEAEALVRLERDGRRTMLRPAHPVVGESIRNELGDIATRAAIEALLRLQSKTDLRRRDDQLRRAVWKLDIGSPVDHETLLVAGRRALQLMDPLLAERLASAARTGGGQMDATVLLAAALAEQNRFEDAERHLASVEDQMLAGPDAASYAVQRGYTLGIGLGRLDDALDFLGRARPRVATTDRSRVEAVLALLMAVAFRRSEAAELAEALLAAGDVEPVVRLTATTPVTVALAHEGLVEQAAARCLEVLPLAEQHADELPRERIWVYGPLVAAWSWAGRYDEVEAAVRPVYDAAVSGHDDFLRGSAANELGALALESGRPAEARRWLLEALAPLATSDPYGFRATAHARLAIAEALCGDVDAARRSAARATDSIRGQLRWNELELYRAEIWTLAADHDHAGARRLAVDDAARTTSSLNRGFLLHDAIRLGDSDPRTLETLVELTDRFEGPRFAAIGAHARGLVAADPQRLRDAADALAAHDSLLAAADAAAEASQLHDGAGDRRAAAEARRRSLDLLADAGAAPTPAVSALTPTPLTEREQEIVTLAGSGLSDREISERLHLSIRTVENHLYRAYAKLGVTGRESLTGTDRPDDTGTTAASGRPRP